MENLFMLKIPLIPENVNFTSLRGAQAPKQSSSRTVLGLYGLIRAIHGAHLWHTSCVQIGFPANLCFGFASQRRIDDCCLVRIFRFNRLYTGITLKCELRDICLSRLCEEV